jgi:hypothetical protein
MTPYGSSSPNVSSSTDWLICCGTNTGTTPNNILINGVGSGTATGGSGNSKLTINNGSLASTESSDFLFQTVIIWDVGLTESQKLQISNLLTNYLSTGSIIYPWVATIGTSPSITSITTDKTNTLYVNFSASTGGNPAVTTYYYSLDGGSTYTNANTTTSPIVISGLSVNTTYQVALIANSVLGNTSVSNIVSGTTYVPCFLEGSKILRFNLETYRDEYTPVETLRKGDLIFTSESGYKRIHSIGYKTITNPKSDPNPSNRLYKFCNKTCYSVFEPLYITGEHCTLHRKIPDEKRKLITDHMGDVYITEEFYRMPAFLDDRASPYDGADEPATIWHFALEHENVAFNYGVYANGLLVESCAIESLSEKSGMKLLEE